MDNIQYDIISGTHAWCENCKAIKEVKRKERIVGSNDPQIKELISIDCVECGRPSWEAMARYNREKKCFVWKK